MRKTRSLFVGVLCGIACMAGVLLYVHDIRASVEAERAEALSRYGATQIEVYVASRDIATGTKADSTNVERKTLPSELLPEGAVADLTEIEGRPAQADVYRGEVLVAKRFEEASGATVQVPDGMCAVSVPAKAVSAVGGSVSPGVDVDVYSTTATATDLLVSNVRVLSTSAAVDSKKGASSDVSWITLSVKPDMVSELIAAAGSSELYFALPSEKLTAADVQSASKKNKESGASDAAAEREATASNEDEGSRAQGGESEAQPLSADAGAKEGKES